MERLFTGKECTGTDILSQRIKNVHEVNFNLVTHGPKQTDGHSDIWTSSAASSQLKIFVRFFGSSSQRRNSANAYLC